jgi:hypothetical protein
MKIYEIISESRLTEAPGAPVVAEFINGMLKGMAWTLGRGPRTKAAEELAKVWAAEMIAAGKPTIKLGTKTAEQLSADILTAAKMDPALAADKAVREEGFNAAKKIFLEAENKGLLKDVIQGAKKVSGAVGKVTNVVASGGKWLTRALAVWECADVWLEFSKEQEELKKDLASNVIDEAQYIKDTRSDWIVFLGKVGVAIIGSGVIGVFGMGAQAGAKALFISKLEKTGPWTATLKNIIETATPLALLAFFKYLNSKEGNRMFVDYLTSAGGKWKGVDGIIEWATSPSQFLDVAGGILQGGGSNNGGPTPPRPAQSGQQQSPAPVVGTTPGGATVSGDWK